MDKKVKAIYKEPGEKSKVVMIDGNKDAIGELLAGEIRSKTFYRDAFVFHKEVRPVVGFGVNASVQNIDFSEPVVITGRNEFYEISDVPEHLIDEISNYDVDKKIKAIFKESDETPKVIEIGNTLSAMQKAVGGQIEAVPISEDTCVICDENGRIFEKPYNCHVNGISFVGTILIVGVDGEEFSDVPQWLIDDVFGSDGYEKKST